MEHEQDVERLFSWFKAPMVHYREFAPQTEVAEAAAAWPAVHRAAVQTGNSADLGPAPQGDTAARERLARDRLTFPLAPPPVPVPETPPAAVAGPTPGRLEDRSSSPGLAATLGQRLQAERQGGAVEPHLELAAEAPPLPAEPPMTTFDEPGPARAAPPPPDDRRGELFGGEYRGREREARLSTPVADRQDRSLDAVFSRLSGTRGGLPDPRARSRTSPGLGAVFGRLR